MSQLNYHQLTPIRLPILNKLYKNHYPAGKAKRDEIIWIGESSEGIECAVRFKQIGSMQLLTGMLVIPERRGKGLAHQLLNACQQQIRQKPCYCFAYCELEQLYQVAGFNSLKSEQLPNELKSRFDRYCNSGKRLIPMKYYI